MIGALARLRIIQNGPRLLSFDENAFYLPTVRILKLSGTMVGRAGL